MRNHHRGEGNAPQEQPDPFQNAGFWLRAFPSKSPSNSTSKPLDPCSRFSRLDLTHPLAIHALSTAVPLPAPVQHNPFHDDSDALSDDDNSSDADVPYPASHQSEFEEVGLSELSDALDPKDDFTPEEICPESAHDDLVSITIDGITRNIQADSSSIMLMNGHVGTAHVRVSFTI
ncbi:hypothetical protein B7494_g2801 [Chlorociboria aeruginascens]|nr:hypothetical protein B7494_g2801 [Chlorociboria aeruginascens]